MAGYVYILASREGGTLYVGVTSALVKRISEHKQKAHKGFTQTYNVSRLVYYEVYDTIEDAILREKQVKEWKRAWKIELIEKENPHWLDLFTSVAG